jgi:hypothetical protein
LALRNKQIFPRLRKTLAATLTLLAQLAAQLLQLAAGRVVVAVDGALLAVKVEMPVQRVRLAALAVIA